MCSKLRRIMAVVATSLLLAGCAQQSSGEVKLLYGVQQSVQANDRSVTVQSGELFKEYSMSAEVSYVKKTVVRLEADEAQYVETCVVTGQTVQAGDRLAVFHKQGDDVRLTAIEQELKMLALETQDSLDDLETQREELLEQKEEVAGKNGYSSYRDKVSDEVLNKKLEKLELQRQQLELRAGEQERVLKAEREELYAARQELIVTAPVDGVVGQLQYFNAGVTCTRGQAILTIYDPDEFLLVSGEGLTGALRVGQKVEIQYGRFNERKILTGTVVAADSALPVNLQSGQAAVRLDEEIQPSQLLSATVYSAQMQVEDVLILPRDAVRYESGQAYVELLVDGAPSKRYVLTGPNDGENIAILSGLEEGWKVALN